MKNSWFWLLGLSLWIIFLPSCRSIRNVSNSKKNSTTIKIDSFLVSMDEYRIVNMNLKEKIDSLILNIEEIPLDYSSNIPIFIVIRPFKKAGHLLFGIAQTKAYALEFIPPDDQYIQDDESKKFYPFATDAGCGALFYRGYLIKLGATPEAYRFIDENGNQQTLFEVTREKISFYAYTKKNKKDMLSIDLIMSDTYYYLFKNGDFILQK